MEHILFEQIRANNQRNGLNSLFIGENSVGSHEPTITIKPTDGYVGF